MEFQRVHLEGVEVIEGPDRVTSKEVEFAFEGTLRRLGHRVGMLESLTGVLARRLFPIDAKIVDLEVEAARKLLEVTKTDANSIDLIINSSVCKDYIEPSVASGVHAALRLRSDTLNFDVSNACLGFLNAMQIAAMMIESGQIDRALIVDAENARAPLEATVRTLQSVEADEAALRSHLATLTLGSGAVAMLLVSQQVATVPHRFRGGFITADTSQNHLCRGTATQMQTDAIGLLKAGVALGSESVRRANMELGWSSDAIDWVVMHQVGIAHTRAMLKAIGFPESKAFITYDEFGNMGPAAIPITLRYGIDAGIGVGDRIALMGIGSGLNCGMMEVVW